MATRLEELSERRIAELEVERDRLRARVVELEEWRAKIRETVGCDRFHEDEDEPDADSWEFDLEDYD